MNAFPEFVSYLLKPTVEELWQRCRTFMRSESDWIANEVKNGVYSLIKEIDNQRPRQVRLLFIANTLEAATSPPVNVSTWDFCPYTVPDEHGPGNFRCVAFDGYCNKHNRQQQPWLTGDKPPLKLVQSYGGATLSLKKDEEQAYQWFPQEVIGKGTVIICFGGQITGAFVGNLKVDLSPPHGSCPMVMLPCSTQVGQAITLRVKAD